MEAWLFHPGNVPPEHCPTSGLQILDGRRHIRLPKGVQSHTSVRKAGATGCLQILREKSPLLFSSSLLLLLLKPHLFLLLLLLFSNKGRIHWTLISIGKIHWWAVEVFVFSIIMKLRGLNFQGQVMVRAPGDGELRHLEREHSDSPRAYDNLSAQNVRNSSYEGNTAFVTFKIRVCAVSKVSRCHCSGKSRWNGQTVAVEAENVYGATRNRDTHPYWNFLQNLNLRERSQSSRDQPQPAEGIRENFIWISKDGILSTTLELHREVTYLHWVWKKNINQN